MLTRASRRESAASLFRLARRFRRAAGGATMVEYGLIVALMSVAIISSVTMIGDDIAAVMQAISDAF